MYESLILVSLPISVYFQLSGGARVASWPRPDFLLVSCCDIWGFFLASLMHSQLSMGTVFSIVLWCIVI